MFAIFLILSVSFFIQLFLIKLMPPKTPKRKLNELTLEQKVKVIQKIQSGALYRTLASEYKCFI